MLMTDRILDVLARQAVEQRAKPRVEMSLPILVTWRGVRHSAMLRNLSCGGALVEVSALLEIEDAIEVHCGSINSAGAVLWRGVSSFGIQFTKPIEERQLAEQWSRAMGVARRRKIRVATLINLPHDPDIAA